MQHLRNQRWAARSQRAPAEDKSEIAKLRAEVRELREIIIQIGQAAEEHMKDESHGEDTREHSDK